MLYICLNFFSQLNKDDITSQLVVLKTGDSKEVRNWVILFYGLRFQLYKKVSKMVFIVNCEISDETMDLMMYYMN